LRRAELLLAVVEHIAPLGLDAGSVLTDHCVMVDLKAVVQVQPCTGAVTNVPHKRAPHTSERRTFHHNPPSTSN
jgi:hypothetical protein